MTSSKIPTPVDFLLNEPMYEETVYEGEEVWAVLDVLYFKGTFDCYCPKCGKEATFKAIAGERPKEFVRNKELERAHKGLGLAINYPAIEQNTYKLIAQCARQSTHFQHYFFLVDSSPTTKPDGSVGYKRTIQKIGQHPSFADLNLPKVKKYAPVLDKKLLSELNKAIGLASHDVGVGAYVYLRRVFEALVEEAHQLAAQDVGWDEEPYLRSRMSERIDMLRTHLPSFLVENPNMYSLLSKGVHEMTEEECLEHFNALRLGIELILDEKLEQREKERKITEAKKALGQATKDSSTQQRK